MLFTIDHICLYGYAARGRPLSDKQDIFKDHICLYGYAASGRALYKIGRSDRSYLLVWVCCERSWAQMDRFLSGSYLLVWVCCETVQSYSMYDKTKIISACMGMLRAVTIHSLLIIPMAIISACMGMLRAPSAPCL